MISNKYSVGHKLLCIKNYRFEGYTYFIKGQYYEIASVDYETIFGDDNEYVVVNLRIPDHKAVSTGTFTEVQCGIYSAIKDHFLTQTESRNIKINNLLDGSLDR